MQFDKSLEINHKNSGKYREYGFRDKINNPPDSQYEFSRLETNYKWLYFTKEIRNNKQLQLLVTLAGILILCIIIVLIVVLHPLISRLFDYISQYGEQGLIDKIWKGSTK